MEHNDKTLVVRYRRIGTRYAYFDGEIPSAQDVLDTLVLEPASDVGRDSLWWLGVQLDNLLMKYGTVDNLPCLFELGGAVGDFHLHVVCNEEA